MRARLLVGVLSFGVMTACGTKTPQPPKGPPPEYEEPAGPVPAAPAAAPAAPTGTPADAG